MKTDALPDEKPDAGLLAFASESGPSQPAQPAAKGLGRRATITIAVLSALVVLEAVPAALWIRDRFTAPSSTALASAVATPPPVGVMAAPCDASAIVSTSSAPAPADARSAAAATAPVPAVPTGMAAGLISIAAPVPMHVYARGRLVGTTEADTMLLPLGTHELVLESAAAGFKTTRTVTVVAGRTTAVRVEPPMGTLHVNAVPWAEVWIDNRRVGETPIGNLQTAIGSREIVFRHPDLGERRTTVLVTMKAPARVSMDMRTK